MSKQAAQSTTNQITEGVIWKQLLIFFFPILFGTFQDKNTRTIIDRFYFLGDWIDEYCDLTLDKMVNETIKKTGVDIRKEISTPQDIQELKAQLDNLDNQFRQTERKAKIKQSIFSKVRSVIFK